MSKETERTFKYIENELSKLNLSDEKEANEALQKIIEEYNKDPDKHLNDMIPETELDKADYLISQAFEEENGNKRTKLLEKAIQICNYACDAYDMLAEEMPNPYEAVEFLKIGIENFEKHYGIKYFKENKGSFWGIMETRPYMRAYAGLSIILLQLGSYSESIEKMEYMLELCPNDNIGIRYRLLNTYVLLERFKDAKKLLKKYPERSAFFLYTEFIMEYKQRDYKNTLKILKEAYKANKYIYHFLVGKDIPELTDTSYYSQGSIEEADIYIEDASILLISIPTISLFLDQNKNVIK